MILLHQGLVLVLYNGHDNVVENSKKIIAYQAPVRTCDVPIRCPIDQGKSDIVFQDTNPFPAIAEVNCTNSEQAIIHDTFASDDSKSFCSWFLTHSERTGLVARKITDIPYKTESLGHVLRSLDLAAVF